MAAPAFPATIKERWLSRDLTGEAQHVLVVRVRPGYMKHDYLSANRIDNGSPIYPPLIWKGHNHNCWKGEWTPTGPWVTLPEIQSASFATSFQSIGEVGGTGGSGSGSTSSVLTVVMDNVGFEPVTGEGGLYHTIQRGYFSPLRGAPLLLARPALWASTPWTNALNGGYQIELWEGYGPPGDASTIPLAEPITQTINGRSMSSCAPADAAITRTWTGIIETVEPTSWPDDITITARDFGVMFTDQRCMGWNKAREIRAPTRFSDRKQTQGQIEIAGPYNTNSGDVLPGGYWLTSGHSDPDDYVWLEMDIPAGYYEDFFWAPRYAGESMCVSIYMGPGGGTRRTGDAFAEGWVDIGDGSVDGVPYVRRWGNVIKYARRWSFNPNEVDGYNVPDGSKIRLTFSNLQKDPTITKGNNVYCGGGQAFYAYKFGSDPSKSPGLLVNATHWVLVEDASDVVRMLCIWAGFQEWSIENFGWSLAHALVYGEDSFFMDIINDALAQGNFMFWMAPPTDDDRSIGVPVFQHQTATDPPPNNMVEIRDVDLLEAADVIWDNSDLPYVMRVRGNLNKDGQTLDQDTQKRYMATYYPPWAGGDYSSLGEPTSVLTRPDRVAGIRRHFTETLGAQSTIGLNSDAECLFGCVLAAIQYALQMAIINAVTIAGLPAFDLNQQISVVDEGTGLNARVWVASIQSNHNMGPNGSWHMTLGGSVIDTEDMVLIAQDYAYAWWKQHAAKQQSGETTSQGYAPPQLDTTTGIGLS